MRLALLVLYLLAVRSTASERPFDFPLTSPDAQFEAVFPKTAHEQTESEGTRLVIKDREHQTVFEDELNGDVARNANWTHDGKFLVVTAVNGAGHQPWHYHAYVFSVDARALRPLDEPTKTPFVSAEIFMQPPHTVILIGHTFEHDMVAPDDPVLLRFDLATLWPKLRKV
jgi:hypothetical protein